MASLRQVLKCNGVTHPDVSILRDLFGHSAPAPQGDHNDLVPVFPRVAQDWTESAIAIPVVLSVAAQLHFGAGPRFHYVFRPIDAAHRTPEDWRKMNAALAVARVLWGANGFGIGHVEWRPVEGDAEYDVLGGSTDLDSLADRNPDNVFKAVQVFWVGRFADHRAGVSGGGQPCPAPSGEFGQATKHDSVVDQITAACIIEATTGIGQAAVATGLGLLFGVPVIGAPVVVDLPSAIATCVGAGMVAKAALFPAALAVGLDDDYDLYRGLALMHETGHYLGASYSLADKLHNLDDTGSGFHSSVKGNFMTAGDGGWSRLDWSPLALGIRLDRNTSGFVVESPAMTHVNFAQSQQILESPCIWQPCWGAADTIGPVGSISADYGGGLGWVDEAGDIWLVRHGKWVKVGSGAPKTPHQP